MRPPSPKQTSSEGLHPATQSWLTAHLLIIAASVTPSAIVLTQKPQRRLSNLAALRLALWASVSLMLSHGAASAQGAQEAGGSEPTCRILGSREAEPSNALLAACGRRGINLGPVDRYRVFPNLADDFLVVELERAGRVQVYLLAVSLNGAVVVENLTGSLARLAGRSATSSIDSLELEYSQVAVNGRIMIARERDAGERDQTSVRELNVPFDVGAAVSSARSSKEGLRPAQLAPGEEVQ